MVLLQTRQQIDTVFVAERDNEILSVAILQSPEHKESSIIFMNQKEI